MTYISTNQIMHNIETVRVYGAILIILFCCRKLAQTGQGKPNDKCKTF